MAEFTDEHARVDMLELSSDIVSAYVANNMVPTADLPRLISDVHAALSGLAKPKPAPVTEKQAPAVPIRKSITPDFLVCLEDGQRYKSLRRHLRTKFGLTPQQYREKWALPADYPMVAPNYAAERSELAKKSGLGRKAAIQEAPPVQTKRRSTAAPKPATPATPKPRRSTKRATT